MADNPRVVPASWGYSPMPSDNTLYTDYNGWDSTNQPTPANSDVYMIFPFGDYLQFRRDYVLLYGAPEFIPLKAFGLWYSMWWPYTQQECLDNIDHFHTERFPLDNYVVDTDWRNSGSSGYDVNTTLFPDMAQFFVDAHAKNVKIIFNDHPEPVNGEQCLSQDDLLFRNLNLRRLLDMGLDYWWFDRNWDVCIVSPWPELPKESLGAYLYHDVAKSNRPGLRPFIMANFDGINDGKFDEAPTLSSHRYTCQWTGDTDASTGLGQEIVNSIRTGVLTGFPYLSSDISGFYGNISNELYSRWTQYAAFSPIFRFHGNRDQKQNRMPWFYGEGENVARNYVLMRYRLLPLFYSLAHLTLETGLPIVRRVDLSYPEYPEADDDTEFTLGTGIRQGGVLVAPIDTFNGSFDGTAVDVRTVFIPDGKWIDVWTGASVVGPTTTAVKHAIPTSPVYVRAGTIIPLVPNVDYIGQRGWDSIILDVYPSTTLVGTSLLYEDDGETTGYQDWVYRQTNLATTYDSTTKLQNVTIGAAQGVINFKGVFGSFTDRNWKVRFHAPAEWGHLTGVTVNGVAQTNITFFDKAAPDEPTVSPFAVAGAAYDSDVYEVSFTAPLTQGTTVTYGFDSPQ